MNSSHQACECELEQACEHVSAHASRSAAACSAAWPGVGSSDAIGIVLCSRRDLHLNTLVVLVIADFLVTSRLRSSSEPCNIICPSLMNVNIHSYIHGTFIPLRQLLLPTVFENNPKIAQTATISDYSFRAGLPCFQESQAFCTFSNRKVFRTSASWA